MVKTLCIGITAAAVLAIAIAADAADLSMTPIYQTLPSAAATLAAGVKDQSRLASVPDRERFKLSPGTGAIISTGAPLTVDVFWTGLNDRF